MDGVPHGCGTFIWEDDSEYEGGWKHGKQHGSGLHASGDRLRGYIGDWQNGVKHGQGFQQLSDGRTFEGTFTDGLAGSGVLTLQGQRLPRERALALLYVSTRVPVLV